ncbi:hypothetical protein D3C84_1320480 [compost metagenome]
MAVRLSAAGAHLLSTGSKLRCVREPVPSGSDALVFRLDPQRCRTEFPAPDARRLPG